jgi:hypothetical protein
MGSVANYRKQESWGSQVIGFPRLDFRILPQKGKFATEPVILLRHISEESLDPLLYLALQDVSAVLGRPDQVVQSIVDGMGSASEDHPSIVPPQPVFGSGHRAHCQTLSFPPAASSGAASVFFVHVGIARGTRQPSRMPAHCAEAGRQGHGWTSRPPPARRCDVQQRKTMHHDHSLANAGSHAPARHPAKTQGVPLARRVATDAAR